MTYTHYLSKLQENKSYLEPAWQDSMARLQQAPENPTAVIQPSAVQFSDKKNCLTRISHHFRRAKIERDRMAVEV